MAANSAAAGKSYKNILLKNTRKNKGVNNAAAARRRALFEQVLPVLGWAGYKPEAYQAQQTSREFRNRHNLLESIAPVRLGNLESTPLMAAAMSGDVERVRRLLAAKVPLEARDQGGFTALLIAALYNQFPVLKELVEKGADLSAVNNYGRGVLTLAIQSGNRDMVDYLLSKQVPYSVHWQKYPLVGFGHPINVHSPLRMAYNLLKDKQYIRNREAKNESHEPFAETFEYLLELEPTKRTPEEWATIQEALFGDALDHLDDDMLQYLNTIGFQWSDQIISEDRLASIIQNNRLDILRTLVSQDGFSIPLSFREKVHSNYYQTISEGQADEYTGSVLVFAIQETKSLPMVKFLLEHGADINGFEDDTMPQYGWNNNNEEEGSYPVSTPILKAAILKLEDIFIYLLEKGADIRERIQHRDTLVTVVEFGTLGMLRALRPYLLKTAQTYGRRQLLIDEFEFPTALKLAIQKKNYEILEELLDIIQEAYTQERSSPIIYLDQLVDIPLQNNTFPFGVSSSPLGLSAFYHDETAINMLLFAGADANSKNGGGTSILDMLELGKRVFHPPKSLHRKLRAMLVANGAKKGMPQGLYGGRRRTQRRRRAQRKRRTTRK